MTKHKWFKANAAAHELNTVAHQKHEPRRPVRSGVVNSHTSEKVVKCIAVVIFPGCIAGRGD